MARKAGLLKQAGELIGDFKQGFRDDYGIGQEDMRAAGYRKRELQGKQKEAPKMVGMAEAHAGLNRAREIAGQISPEGQQALNEAGLNFRTDLSPAYRAGQVVGTVAGDITQDATRRFYWLLNAAQATGEVINELALATANPALYGRHTLKDKAGNLYGYNTTAAVRDGIVVPKGVDEAGNSIYEPARGIQWDKEQGAYTKRNFEPGHVQSLAIPTGIAVNSAMGLLTPFGGAEGYKAAVPSAEDPTKTDNVLAEIGLKYIMGRTGNLLPYDEFSKVRPDVSRDEYNKYQAFKYDKRADMDLSDGDIGLPGGAIKYTNEGIHGPEVQFLGRSIPVTTGIVPYLGALAGGVAGVRTKRPIKGGFLGGMAGLAAGGITGNLLEQERRRRNLEENLEDGTIKQ